VGKLLVVFGLAVAGIGVLMLIGLPLFRLPGDVRIERGNFSFYLPITTSILLSVLLTLLLTFFRR
jgi:hypothetical protein